MLKISDNISHHSRLLTHSLYDGRLVVDHNFRTNDPCVYAGGVITKFARRYRCNTRMEICSNREAGSRLAQVPPPHLTLLSCSECPL